MPKPMGHLPTASLPFPRCLQIYLLATSKKNIALLVRTIEILFLFLCVWLSLSLPAQIGVLRSLVFSCWIF
jgi:hypothetical protein